MQFVQIVKNALSWKTDWASLGGRWFLIPDIWLIYCVPVKQIV